MEENIKMDLWLKKLIDAEREKNDAIYGTEFSSNHEFYGVIKEEIEESQEIFKTFDDLIAAIWTYTKMDLDNKLVEGCNHLEKMITYGIKELIQVLAICQKYRDQKKDIEEIEKKDIDYG